MKARLFFALVPLLLVASLAGANTAKTVVTKPRNPAAAKLPQILKDVEAKYSKAQTLTAEFEETNMTSALKQVKKSTGVLEFKRPGKVRWETLKPDKNLLISDGKKFWYYTPPFDPDDNGQYVEKNASQVQTKLAQILLSGSFSSDEALKATKIEQLGRNEFVLVPKKGSAGTVTQAKIKIDPATKLITEVHLVHKGGNRSKITLSKIELGKPLDDSTFVFSPPPKTEKIEQ